MGGGGSTSGSGHTDGLWWVPKILIRQMTPVGEKGPVRKRSPRPDRLLFLPGSTSPCHWWHLWGWLGHQEAGCPEYSGGRPPWLGGVTADSPWCTWSGTAIGLDRPCRSPEALIQGAKTETPPTQLSCCSMRSFLSITKLIPVDQIPTHLLSCVH